MMMPGENFLSAQDFFLSPPITTTERISSQRNVVRNKTDHPDYMDFAERYADYVVEYEKANSK